MSNNSINLTLTVKAMQAGILPAFSSFEIKEYLKSCSPEQSRALRRKFRKLWRKEMKSSIKEVAFEIEKSKIKLYFLSRWYRRHSVKKFLKNQIKKEIND
jgi:hypothetical protein